MSKKETLCTRYGELLDLIDCRRIDCGFAKVKTKLTFDEIMQME